MAENFQIRINDEERVKFKKLAEELGMTHGATLSALMNSYELDKISKAVPDAQADVEKFAAHLAQVQRIFTGMVESISMQSDLARERVRHELEAKDKIIADLQKRTEKAEEEAKGASEVKKKLEKAEEELSQARKTITALQAIRDTMPDPQKYADLAKRVIELEAASIEKDKLIEKLISGRQIEETETGTE